MPRRPGVTLEKIVDAAIGILKRDGVAGLTLTKLARHFKVKPPSLYNHVAGMEDLQRTLRLHGLRELKAELQSAAVGRSGRDALIGLADAYRSYALRNPGLYQLTLRSTEGDDDELQQAGREAVEVVLAVLHGYGLGGEEAVHAARILRCTLHGFVTLESGGGYARVLSTDETYNRLLEFLHSGLASGFHDDTRTKTGANAQQ